MAVEDSATDDPRLDDDHIRTLDDGRITLVGVVHDHPASRYRVSNVVSRHQPDILAVETPPLALPLFRQYAADDRDIPVFGGEISAAIAAATDARVVGIDGIDRQFFETLAANLRADGASLSTVRALGASITSVVRHALVCRLAALLAGVTGIRLEVDHPIDHDCSLRDPPAVQANDERSQLDRSRTLLRLADPPAPAKLRGETREDCMARRLTDLRTDGTVVAVIGRSHLGPLAERLDPAEPRNNNPA